MGRAPRVKGSRILLRFNKLLCSAIWDFPCKRVQQRHTPFIFVTLSQSSFLTFFPCYSAQFLHEPRAGNSNVKGGHLCAVCQRPEHPGSQMSVWWSTIIKRQALLFLFLPHSWRSHLQFPPPGLLHHLAVGRETKNNLFFFFFVCVVNIQQSALRSLGSTTVRSWFIDWRII